MEHQTLIDGRIKARADVERIANEHIALRQNAVEQYRRDLIRNMLLLGFGMAIGLTLVAVFA